MRKLAHLCLCLLAAPLLGGWDWFDKYGSKYEASNACTKWRDAGPVKTVEGWSYQTRVKNIYYAYPQITPKPGRWSVSKQVDSKSDIPGETPGIEVQSWKWENDVKLRSCIPDRDTKQFLGMQEKEVKKRFRY